MIFLSFVIAVALFVVINVVIKENDARRILNATYTYDMELKNMTTLDEDERPVFTEEDIQKLKDMEGVETVRVVTSTEAVVPYQEDVFGTYYKELYESRFSPGNYEEDMELYREHPENDFFTTRLVGIDEEGFRLINQQLGGILDQKAFEAGEIGVAAKMFTEGDNGITGKEVKFFLPEGLSADTGHTIRIAAVGDGNCDPAYFSGGSTPKIIVSEQYAKELMGETYTELIDISYQEPFDSGTEQEVKDLFTDRKEISVTSKLERYEDMKNSETQVKILGNSIGIIIAMLAVLNYINMIAAGIQNRLMEFAIMESIGMTVKQIKKMLIFKGLGYAVISLILAVCIGVPVSYVVFEGMNTYGVSYLFPWVQNLVLFGAIIAVCIGTPVMVYRKTQNASIIEQLRENQD